MLRFRCRGSAARLMLFLLLSMYASLWIVVHYRLPSLAESSSIPSPVVLDPPPKVVNNPFLNVQKPPDEPVDLQKKNTTVMETLFPQAPNFVHFLREGKSISTSAASNLWESTMLPTWMKDYFEWHREQTKRMQEDSSHWKTLRYYIVECSSKFPNCGGTADRLAPLPLHVRLASEHRRYLMISWRDGRPAPLEEFLMPPLGGLDWRMPDWLLKEFLKPFQTRRIATYIEKIHRFGPDETVPWLRVKLQSFDGGQNEYDRRRKSLEDPTYAQVYHDVWRIFFTPNPSIASILESELQRLNLIPGHYHVIHLRALYAVDYRDENLIRWWSQNAVNCAITQLHDSQQKLLFVSDSTVAMQEAVSYGYKYGIPVVSRQSADTANKLPLHLEKDTATSVKDFYDTFVDIWMMGMGRCTVYNMGGFGKLGGMIGYNSSCMFSMKAKIIHCERPQDYHFDAETWQQSKPEWTPPLFVPPIDSGTGTTDAL